MNGSNEPVESEGIDNGRSGRLKYQTLITECNEGNHSPQHTRQAWAWIDQCATEYRSPRLYHLCFAGAEYHAHKSMLKDIAQRLRRKRIRCSWRAAREIDESRGDHLHVFLCCEASLNNPCHILNRKEKGWLIIYGRKRGIKVFINPPLDPMHSGENYMSLPLSKKEKIADAKIWVSYLYKQRSKPEKGEIYSASRELSFNSRAIDLADAVKGNNSDQSPG